TIKYRPTEVSAAAIPVNAAESFRLLAGFGITQFSTGGTFAAGFSFFAIFLSTGFPGLRHGAAIHMVIAQIRTGTHRQNQHKGSEERRVGKEWRSRWGT